MHVGEGVGEPELVSVGEFVGVMVVGAFVGVGELVCVGEDDLVGEPELVPVGEFVEVREDAFV